MKLFISRKDLPAVRRAHQTTEAPKRKFIHPQITQITQIKEGVIFFAPMAQIGSVWGQSGAFVILFLSFDSGSSFHMFRKFFLYILYARYGRESPP